MGTFVRVVTLVVVIVVGRTDAIAPNQAQERDIRRIWKKTSLCHFCDLRLLVGSYALGVALSLLSS